ncbi:MAG: cbb3-type cytochrome c oxidase N-terminal domain-containing protein [Bacteroidota bacterium]
MDRVIQGHTYDGIREYDNPMPGWWVAIFWACVLFAPVYMLGVHVFDWIDDYGDDFAEAGEELEAVRLAYASTGPAFKTDEGALREYASDADMAVAGAVHFGAVCAACHGQQGEGTIGPNLTDAFWLHGAEPQQLWTSIAEGFPEQGMPAMQDQLGDQERAEVMAYVYSIQGTNPPGAKAPQGERTPIAL